VAGELVVIEVKVLAISPNPLDVTAVPESMINPPTV